MQTGWRRWWPFGLLLAVGASRWLLQAAEPGAASTLGSEALGCGWAATLMFVLSYRGGAAIAPDWRDMVAGALLVGGPVCGLLVRGRELDGNGVTIALALTPVVVAIVMAALGVEATEGISGRIWPGLAAVSGLLLVLIQPGLGDLRSDLGLFLAPVLTGAGAAMFCGEREGEGRKIVGALVGAAGLFGVGYVEARFVEGVGGAVSVTAVACDGLLALLGVVALERVGAMRWAAQFTLLPLLILVEGIVLVRPVVTTRWVAGLVLLGVASVFLLLPEEQN